ncbi:hypothetical protein COW99_00290 [Candidatus Roizmanbacteria bacterium CG22_combo_CG10-13_8_21_14_all_38_20]|uniref:Uncharacterized protein n=1 Tax=Candidatus Roizmanbacteria bacterium CG22_combo_CG10-13_8_21_14_all_38_20 TaxID=1974862 RepID=A0A2H0BYK2_9BACT|nr:hypothetical protein [Candidatus Microgenomates bacterium]PIP62110.1 MAG: hypothetical protein COW99_00290 [Candidatus Roizmanbacteria bacterium CG22_combo_CG10-13_8_21_14_all_38_20]PJC31836.1 MAG: hypothetical protein CO050_01975 [Candidatus Roizmanbacteria bacterium CG_4_9_14_0_2_um_filter_38_17]
MQEDIVARLNAQDELLRKIYSSSEKTRKYFMWTLIGTAVMFVLPLIGLAFAIPAFLNNYMGALSNF